MQLYFDDGRGPAMIRVAVAKNAPFGDQLSRGGTATVMISNNPGDCQAGTTVDAEWPDGTLVEVDVPTCLAAEAAAKRSRPALTPDEAVRVATDPRWGVTMDAQLVSAASKRFPSVPVLAE
ncbi:hypothetical protein [Actinoplanes sp. NPDC026619]|uniref:hypothetical protein n=1 Tax=Actinoplanes sp. NPDC026619 TaxID=3155798 RepID=UPI0033C17E11